MLFQRARLPIAAGPVAAAAVFLLLTAADADDWPHWRGPNRNDIVAEASGWKAGRWPVGDALWSRNVGIGSTSPIVVGGRLYTMGWGRNKDSVTCLDAGAGQEIWKRSYNCPQYGRRSLGDKGVYAGPSSTPEYDDETGYLYTLSIDGDFTCWDTTEDGIKVWGLNLYDTYRVPRRPRVGRSGHRDYGYTTSPLVYRDWVIVEVGAGTGTLVAFSKRTGRRQWASQYKGPAGHTGGPVPMLVEGIPCAAVLTHHHLLVVRLDGTHAGRTVATYPWLTSFANNIATPAVYENHVLITSGYNHYAICKLRITLAGATKIWEQPFPSKVCSPIVYKGHVYWCWQNVVCLDFETGKQKWTGARGFGSPGSCIITADGRLIAWGQRGRLVLAETAERSPQQYTELARKEGLFKTEVWPHVVLSSGRLYCKDRSGNLKCLRVARTTPSR